MLDIAFKRCYYVARKRCKGHFTLDPVGRALEARREGAIKHMKNLIVQIRQERGIKQDELAKAMGVSRQTISSLENGRYDPSIFLAYKIAKYFGMTIEEVFLFEEAEK